MPNVDERVVQMTFNNKQFEAGVAESRKTLEDLKNALKLEKAVSGLSKLESAFKGFDLSGLSNNVDKIANKFTLLGQIGQKAIGKISDAVVNTGEKIARSLTVEQISAGMNKYENQTKAVQTIKNATGKSVEDVEKVLEVLMHYTDETSYDFVEMASSIGKFTSVGIDLEVAEKAMEGIANEAALSGAGKAEANRAMYNFAQALSSGSVKLIDWKSIENANMATKEFKEELIKTALELGTLNRTGEKTGSIMKMTKKATKKSAAEYKEMAVNYKTFNQTLSEGWLTTDVLIQTLNRYADTNTDVGRKAYEAAQKAVTYRDAIDAIKDAVSSGWMQSFKYIFGNLDESIELWTGFCNSIIEVTSEISEYRNGLLQVWHEGADGVSGYQLAIEAVSNVWDAFLNIIHAFRDAVATIIPPATGEDLINITQHIKDATDRLRGFFNYTGDNEVEEVIEKVTYRLEGLDDLLQNGMKGDGVKRLQDELIRAGYSMDKFGADGIYGLETENAVKKLQADLGVKQTGVWDAATRQAAEASDIFKTIEKDTQTTTKKVGEQYKTIKYYEKSVNYVQDMWRAHGLSEKYLNKDLGVLEDNFRKKQIKTVQTNLVKLGYLDKGHANGIYGPETKKAMKALQHDLGVTETGYWSNADARAAYEKSAIFDEVVVETEEVTEVMGASSPAIEKFQRIVAGGAAAFDIVSKSLGTLIKLGQHVLNLFNPIVSALGTGLAVVGDLFVKLRDGLDDANAYENWLSRAKTFLEPLGNILQNIGNAIDNFFNTHDFKSFGDLFSAIGEEIRTFFQAFQEKHPEFAKIFGPLINALNTAWDIISDIKWRLQVMFMIIGETFNSKHITSFSDKVKGSFILIRDAAIGILGMIIRKILKAVSKNPVLGPILKRVIKAVKNIVGTARSFIKKIKQLKIGEKIKKSIGYDDKKSVLENVQDKITDAKSKIVGFVKTVSNKIDELRRKYPIIETLGNGIKATFKKLKEFIFDKEGKFVLFDNISKKFTEVKQKLDNGVKDIKTWFSDTIDKIKNKWEELKKEYPFLQKVEDKFKEIKNTIVSAWNYIKSNILSKFSWDSELSFGENITNNFNALKDGISGAFDTINEKIAEFRKEHPAIDEFITKLQSLGGTVSGFADAMVQSITNFFNADVDENASIWDQIKERFGGFQPLIDWFNGVKEKIVNAWNEIMHPEEHQNGSEKEGSKSLLETISEKFGSIDWGKVVGIAITGFIGYISTSLAKGVANFGKGIKNIGKGTTILAEAFKEKLKGEDGEKESIGTTALKIAGAIAIVAAAVAAIAFIPADQAKRGALILVGVISVFAIAMIAINKLGGNGKVMKNFGSMIQSLGIGLLAVVVAFAVLWHTMKDIDLEKDSTKLWYALGIIGGTLLILGTVAVLIAKLGGDSNRSQKGLDPILSMCIGLVIVIGALRLVVGMIDKYGGDDVVGAFGIIAGLLVILGAIVVLTAKFSEGKKVQIKGILFLCAGIYLLALSIGKITKLIDKYGGNDVMGAFGMIVGILTILGAIVVLAGKFGTASGSLAAGGSILIACIGIAIVMKVLGDVIEQIKDADWRIVAALTGGISAMLLIATIAVGVLGGLGVGTALAGAVGLVAVFGALGAGIAILVAVGIWAMQQAADTLWIIASRLEDFDNTTGTIDIERMKSIFNMIRYNIAPALTTLAGKIADSKDALEVSYNLESIGISFSDYYDSIKDIEAEKLDLVKNLANSALEAANTIAQMTDPVAVGQNLYWLTGGITLYYDSIKDFEPDKAAAASTVATGAKDIADMVTAFSDSTGMRSKFSALGGGLKLYYNSIKDFSSEGIGVAEELATSATNIYGTLGTITPEQTSTITQNITDLGAAMKLYYGMLAGIETVDEDGNEIEINPETIKKVFTALSEASPDKTIVDKISAFAPRQDGDLTNFALGITKLGTALKTYGEDISTIDQGNVTTANSILETVKGVWELVVGAAPSDRDRVKMQTYKQGGNRDLSAFTEGITNLGTAIEGYAEDISKLSGQETNIELANGIIDKVSGIWSKFSNAAPDDDTRTTVGELREGGNKDLTNFTLGITNLGNSISSYATNIGGLEKDKVDLANGVIDKFVELQNHLKTQEFWDTLFGWFRGKRTNIIAFGNDIESLGGAIKKYADSTTGLNETDLNNSYGVIDAVVALNDKLPTTGAIWEIFTGKKNLGTFAANIGDLGKGIFNFTEQVKNANFKGHSLAISVIQGIADVFNTLEKAGGLAGFIEGDKDLSNVTKNLGQVGTDLKAFTDATSQIPSSYDPTGAIAALSGLAGVASNMEAAGGLIQAIVGEKSLDTFGDDIAAVGAGLSSFYTSTKDIKLNDDGQYDVSSVIAVLTSMSELEKGLEAQGGLAQLVTGSKNLGTFAKNLGDLGTNLSSFNTATASTDTTHLDAIGTSLTTMVNALATLYDYEWVGASPAMLKNVVNAITENDTLDYTPIENVGKDIQTHLATAIKSNSNLPADSFKTNTSDRITALGYLLGKSSKWFYAGRDICQGLANGIAGFTNLVYNKAYDMGLQALNAAKAAVDSNSPSKKFAELGQNMDEGLIIGLNDYSKNVDAASANVADGALSAATTSFAMLSQRLLSAEDSFQPTIRPVVDMTEVDRGMQTINNLAGKTSVSMGLRTSNTLASGISRSEERQTLARTNTNTDMAGTIAQLSTRVDELGSKISNMKVVTETGALIGQISNGIDRRLGRSAMLARRMN